MLAFLQYLIAFLVVENAEQTTAAGARPDVTGILLAVAAFVLAARVAGVLLARATLDGDDGALPRFLTVATLGRIGGLVLFQVIAGTLVGVRLPAALGVDAWAIVPRLVQMAPFLALVAGLTWGLHPATAAMRVGPKTEAAAVAEEFRSALLPLAPLVVLIGLEDVFRLATPGSDLGIALTILRQLPAVLALVSLGVMFCALLAMPFALRVFLRAKPMPDGPIRRRLEAYSKRIRFGYRDILIWPTDGSLINAAVIGVLPRFRYVLITDALLEALDEDEVEAVFAHEAGHAKRGHILLFFGFTSVVALLGFVPGVGGFIETALAPLPAIVRVALPLLLWLGVVFGWISRRFEQEADVFGIETVPATDAAADPGAHPFARAMERIGAEVGAIREVTGWRHFSIADRVAFVRRYLTDDSVRRRYRRSIGLLRGTLLLVIAAFGVLTVVRVPGEIGLARRTWEVRSAPESLLLVELHQALGETRGGARAERFAGAALLAAMAGRDEDAARWLREAAAPPRREPVVLAAYAAILEKTGRPLGARMLWEEIAGREDVDPRDREAARARAAGGSGR